MFYGRGMNVLCYVHNCLFFGPDQGNIDEFIKELKDSGMALTVEDGVYNFLSVEVKTNKATGKVTLAQSGLMMNALRTAGMQDINRKHTPATTLPLGTDADGTRFCEEWDYAHQRDGSVCKHISIYEVHLRTLGRPIDIGQSTSCKDISIHK
jgi:hypothetical protein